MMRGLSNLCFEHEARNQGHTLVHYSAQCKRFLWDRGGIYGLLTVCEGGAEGCAGCILFQKRLRLS